MCRRAVQLTQVCGLKISVLGDGGMSQVSAFFGIAAVWHARKGCTTCACFGRTPSIQALRCIKGHCPLPDLSVRLGEQKRKLAGAAEGTIAMDVHIVELECGRPEAHCGPAAKVRLKGVLSAPTRPFGEDSHGFILMSFSFHVLFISLNVILSFPGGHPVPSGGKVE